MATWLSSRAVAPLFPRRTSIANFTPRRCRRLPRCVPAGAHVIDRQIVPARQNEMEFFGLQKDALLLHIKRVRTADGEPIFEENIFMPFDAYRELLTADLEDKSIFAEVERVGGTPIVSVGYRTVEAVRQRRAGG